VLHQHETWQISQKKTTHRWIAWRSITTGRVSEWGNVLKEILLDQGILVGPWRYGTRDEQSEGKRDGRVHTTWPIESIECHLLLQRPLLLAVPHPYPLPLSTGALQLALPSILVFLPHSILHAVLL
jgi:hypothetical protein